MIRSVQNLIYEYFEKVVLYFISLFHRICYYTYIHVCQLCFDTHISTSSIYYMQGRFRTEASSVVLNMPNLAEKMTEC